MAARDVRFTFAAAAGDIVTDYMVLQVRDSEGVVAFETSLEKTATSYVATNFPIGTGYVAKLTSYSATKVPDTTPPTVTFDVTAEPPPGDPTLDSPTLV